MASRFAARRRKPRRITAASWLRPSKVVGVALNTYDLDEAAAKDAVKRVEDELVIPATDAIRYGVANLLDAIVG